MPRLPTAADRICSEHAVPSHRNPNPGGPARAFLLAAQRALLARKPECDGFECFGTGPDPMPPGAHRAPNDADV